MRKANWWKPLVTVTTTATRDSWRDDQTKNVTALNPHSNNRESEDINKQLNKEANETVSIKWGFRMKNLENGETSDRRHIWRRRVLRDRRICRRMCREDRTRSGFGLREPGWPELRPWRNRRRHIFRRRGTRASLLCLLSRRSCSR